MCIDPEVYLLTPQEYEMLQHEIVLLNCLLD